ncbi:MAG TPA: 4-hydroxythreonine-4-phosphate dehydrogenase PdxA, partial [Thermaerobacter sp.]
YGPSAGPPGRRVPDGPSAPTPAGLARHPGSIAGSVALGLPIICTSVDHGTAFDIAGTGKASAVSMKRAMLAAGRLAGLRAARTSAAGRHAGQPAADHGAGSSRSEEPASAERGA